MKHKRFDRRNWARATGNQERVWQTDAGIFVDFRAGQVVRPLDVPFRGRTLRILDTGFRWLYFHPAGANHALTVQLDAQDRPVQLYVDICAGGGLDPDGQPFVRDLYLDVLAVCDLLLDGAWQVADTELIDADELEEAVQAGVMEAGQAAFAWAEARRVQVALAANSFGPAHVVQALAQSRSEAARTT